MPVRSLAPKPSLDHLKHQAKDLIKAHVAQEPAAAQRIREFHPRFSKANDAAIFDARLKLSDAQLVIARESGFPSWASLKRRIERPTAASDPALSFYDRIEDKVFLQALRTLDAGDASGLRNHLKAHPDLARRRVSFEGGNYFRNPTLLEFVAENPIRNRSLPKNIVEIAEILLDAGAGRDAVALNETLGLVCSGCVARETGHQIPLIDLLCDRGADPNRGLSPALVHGEFDAATHLLQRGARIDLPAAAALGRVEEAQRLLPAATSEERHLALAFASQFGRLESVRMLLDAGEDPNRYNPPGSHSHSTPLHQAALGGHMDVVRALVEGGARLDIADILWHGSPLDWARHAQKREVERYLAQHGGVRG